MNRDDVQWKDAVCLQKTAQPGNGAPLGNGSPTNSDVSYGRCAKTQRWQGSGLRGFGETNLGELGKSRLSAPRFLLLEQEYVEPVKGVIPELLEIVKTALQMTIAPSPARRRLRGLGGKNVPD